MVITTERVNMSKMETTISKNTSIGTTIEIGINEVGHIFPLKIGKLHLATVVVV